MAERALLTNRLVGSLKAQSERYAVHDRDVKGFVVYVSPQGVKSFFWYGKVLGKPVRRRIGVYPDLACDDARKIAKSIVGELAAGKSAVGRAKSDRMTLADLFDQYLTIHAKPKKRTWQRDAREFDRFVRKPLGPKLLPEIRRADIAALLSKIEDANGKGPARKVRALLHKMFEVAMDEEWAERNPVRGTHRPDFDARQRYLKPSELDAFINAVATLRSDISRDFIWLTLFTGQRRSNVCSMRLDEIDFDNATWRIPKEKYKGKRVHTVPLPPGAVAIIERRRRDNPADCPWVLPSWGPKGHYNNPKAAFATVLERAKLKNLRVHDLRRTMGAWQQAAGETLRTTQMTMGHSTAEETARTYTPVELDQVRAAMGRVVDKILDAAHRQAKASKPER